MKKTLLFAALVCMTQWSTAQFVLDGQYVQRSEFRNGYNRLIGASEDPAAFLGHRARLQASYIADQVEFYMSIQDIRTFGSAPQVKPTDPYLSVHEAWAEFQFNSHWALKVGRQELNYDNARFLGNLDWPLQARAHDFVLAKYQKERHQLHFGGAYNQDAQQLTGNAFTTANQYKTAQMVHFQNSTKHFKYALLFWNDGRQQLQFDSLGSLTDQRIRFRQTIGIPTLDYILFGNTWLSSFAYYQFGEDANGNALSGFDLSAQLNHHLVFGKIGEQALRLIAGFEWLSGTDTLNNAGRSQAFSPLYGTNHLYNGYMDHFYVNGVHESNTGLRDFYLKARYYFNPDVFVQADYHAFYSDAPVYTPMSEPMDPFLGSEMDFSCGYVVNRAVSLQAGYSQFFATTTMQVLRARANTSSTQNWAYLMLVYRPTNKNKFIGILL